MGQITHETVKCIEAAFERKTPNGGFPLTSWEKVQLARAWELLQIIDTYGVRRSTAELSDPARPYAIHVSLAGHGETTCHGATPIEAAQRARDWFARKNAPPLDEIPDTELPGMWERADFTGGQDEVRDSTGNAGAAWPEPHWAITEATKNRHISPGISLGHELERLRRYDEDARKEDAAERAARIADRMADKLREGRKEAWGAAVASMDDRIAVAVEIAKEIRADSAGNAGVEGAKNG